MRAHRPRLSLLIYTLALGSPLEDELSGPTWDRPGARGVTKQETEETVRGEGAPPRALSSLFGGIEPRK